MGKVSVSRSFNGTIPEIKEKFVAALKAANFKVQTVEDDKITAQSGFSLTSLGSEITILLDQIDENTVKALFNLEAKQKTVLTDWGRSRRELNKILKLLETNISSESPASSRQCPSCHTAVLDEDLFCATCGTKLK